MADIKYTTEGVDFKGTFIPWAELEAERNKIRFANSVLVKVGFTYGRQDILDQEIWDKDEWEKEKALITGLTAWFHDFAGKHSETSVTAFDNVNLEEITDLKEILDFHAIHGLVNNDLDIIQSIHEQGVDNGDISPEGERITPEE